MNRRLPVIMLFVRSPESIGVNIKRVFSIAAKPKAIVMQYIIASIGSSKYLVREAIRANIPNFIISSMMAQAIYLYVESIMNS